MGVRIENGWGKAKKAPPPIDLIQGEVLNAGALRLVCFHKHLFPIFFFLSFMPSLLPDLVKSYAGNWVMTE